MAGVRASEWLSLLTAGRLTPHHPPRQLSPQLGARAIPLGITDVLAPTLCLLSPLTQFLPCPLACTSPIPSLSVRCGHPQGSVPSAQTPQILSWTSACTCLRCLKLSLAQL